MIKYVYDILQYNEKANIIKIEIPDKEKIRFEIKNKCPLIINHKLDLNLTVDSMNYKLPGYIINNNNVLLSLDQLNKSENINVYNNRKIIKDYNIDNYYLKIEELFSNIFSCNSNHYLSIYRGEQKINLHKNYREYLLFQPILGKVIFYLFNPKHEKDIKGLPINSIKKWGIKVELHKDQLLYIPPEWSYIYELNNKLNDDIILSQIEFDSYATILYNFIRKKIYVII
jgi:hypothetical protein